MAWATIPGRAKFNTRGVNKDGFTPKECDEINIPFKKEFDSKREYERYLVLTAYEAQGKIRDLKRQVPMGIYAHGPKGVKKVATYMADFTYEEADAHGHWHPVIEDAKGFKTATYKLKKKFIEAQYGFEIKET